MGVPSTATTPNGQSASRIRRRPTRTNSPCDAKTSAPYGWHAIARNAAAPQSAQRRLPPRSIASTSARYESALVNRKRLYIRP